MLQNTNMDSILTNPNKFYDSIQHFVPLCGLVS